MIDRLDGELRFQQEALDLRARRQEVLSANIAHADTPDYKARDFDFSETLKQTIERGRNGQSLALNLTSLRHLPGKSGPVRNIDLLYRVPAQSSIDGNTVEMDVERVNFADNAVRYESNLTVVSAKVKTLLSALQQ